MNARLRRNRKRYYRRKVQRLSTAGLTTRGTQPRYQFHGAIAHLHGPARKRAYQRLTRLARTARGLTTRGAPRQHTLHPELAHLPPRERHTAYCRLWLNARYERGLTARGTPSRHAPSPLELAWRELRSTMNIPTTDFLTLGERNHDRE